MTEHLSDEQIEDVIQGGEPPEHLGGCERCRSRLEEARALGSRLRRAYVHAVRPDDRLGEQVRHAIRRAGRRHSRLRVIGSRYVVAALAAAAVLVVGVPLAMHLAAPQAVQAAQSELVQIHQANLLPHSKLYGAADPAQVAQHLHRELGFVPNLPRLGAGMALRGCCVAHFRNRPVGSYVVDSDQGVISVIVIRGGGEELGLTASLQRGGRTYRTGAFARSRMAAIRIGPYTYCAVGEVGTDWLVGLLEKLL